MTQNNLNGNICAEEYVVKRGDSFYLIAHKLGVPLRDLLAANRNIHPARLMVGDVLCIPREEDDSPESGGLAGGTTGGNIGGTNGSSGGAASGTAGGSNGGSAGNAGGTAGGNTSGTAGSSGSAANSSTGNGGNTNGSTGGTAGGNTGSSGGTAGGSGGNITTATCPVDQQYSVENGQTVEDIQLRSLLSRHTLETANPGINLDLLRAGQVLCVPKENVPCVIPNTYTLAQGETLESLAVRFNLPVGRLLRANPCLAPQDFEAGASVIIPSN